MSTINKKLGGRQLTRIDGTKMVVHVRQCLIHETITNDVNGPFVFYRFHALTIIIHMVIHFLRDVDGETSRELGIADLRLAIGIQTAEILQERTIGLQHLGNKNFFWSCQSLLLMLDIERTCA